MREFTVFNNRKIIIEAKIAELYEKCTRTSFTNDIAEYLISAMELNNENTDEDLYDGLIKGILEEIEIMNIAPIIIEKYKNNGN